MGGRMPLLVDTCGASRYFHATLYRVFNFRSLWSELEHESLFRVDGQTLSPILPTG